LLTFSRNVFKAANIIQSKQLMNETLIKSGYSASLEQKQAALDSVLNSHTFARADQLKSFLKFVCEMEFAGRGQELTEYLIAVEALGRPSSYSPGDDSAVRNRAFALRKKLQEYYEHEQPEAPIRIELTKGSYCPHFSEKNSIKKLNGSESMAFQADSYLVSVPPVPEVSIAEETGKSGFPRNLALSFLAGVIVTAVVALALYLWKSQPAGPYAANELAPVIAEAWGPILDPKSDILICVANPPSFSIHPQATPMPRTADSLPPFIDPGGQPMPADLYALYGLKYPAPAQQNLFLTVTTNATYWGDSLAAMTALKTLLPVGATPHLFPEKVITRPTLRHRNVILFGAPEYSPAVAHFLEKCPLTLNFLDGIVESKSGQAPSRIYAARRDAKNSPALTYGLITVLPSESSTSQHRTVIFSGVNSAGTQAAAEFFSSPEHLNNLKNQLQKDGHKNFPAAYQVVVSSETDDSILLNFRYETYRIIPVLSN